MKYFYKIISYIFRTKINIGQGLTTSEEVHNKACELNRNRYQESVKKSTNDWIIKPGYYFSDEVWELIFKKKDLDTDEIIYTFQSESKEIKINVSEDFLLKNMNKVFNS